MPGAGLGQLLNELQLPLVGSKKLLENPQDAKSGVQEFVCMGVFPTMEVGGGERLKPSERKHHTKRRDKAAIELLGSAKPQGVSHCYTY